MVKSLVFLERNVVRGSLPALTVITVGKHSRALGTLQFPGAECSQWRDNNGPTNETSFRVIKVLLLLLCFLTTEQRLLSDVAKTVVG